MYEVASAGWWYCVDRDPVCLCVNGVQPPRTDTDRRSYSNDDTDGSVDGNVDAYVFINTNRHTNGDILPYANADCNVDGNADRYAHGNADANLDADRYVDVIAHTNVDPTPATNLDADPGVCNAYGHTRTGGTGAACLGYAARQRYAWGKLDV